VQDLDGQGKVLSLGGTPKDSARPHPTATACGGWKCVSTV